MRLGSRKSKAIVRHYADTIADMDRGSTNAYVMAFDAANEIMWTVQAGDGVEAAREIIDWDGVARVEIYDHNPFAPKGIDAKMEFVYITTAASLAQYCAERRAAEVSLALNTTIWEPVFA